MGSIGKKSPQDTIHEPVAEKNGNHDYLAMISLTHPLKEAFTHHGPGKHSPILKAFFLIGHNWLV